MRFLDGFTAALLAAHVLPLLVSTLTPLLAASGRDDVPPLVAALITGPLIGGSVGFGLWRSATVLHVVGGPSVAAPAVAGVAAGLVVGQLVHSRTAARAGRDARSATGPNQVVGERVTQGRRLP